MKFKSYVNKVNSSSFIRNSLWGLVATFFQTVFLSLFFIILSRNYNIVDFANFLVSNTIYQLLVGISSMGLGHWFIREYEHTEKGRSELIYRFLKIQIIMGVVFYIANIFFAYLLYSEDQIRLLAIILGTNIIFDNIIYAIKHLNIAQFEQKKSALIMALDGFLRLLIAGLLYLSPFSLIVVSLLLVAVRLVTVNIFITMGSSGSVNLMKLLRFKITWDDLNKNVFQNWKFILIVGSSILFWRSATLIISKTLSPADIANYEVCYKIFSIFTMVVVVASTTVYPKFVQFFVKKDMKKIRKFYKLTFLVYTVFGAVSYAIVQSYASEIIFIIFGNKFQFAADCLKEMYLTLLIFPTILLQANLIVAMKMEKVDMYLNFLALIINLLGCMIGLYFYKSLSVINYSIFGSFLIFHISQSYMLVRLKVSTVLSTLSFYLLIGLLVFGYHYGLSKFNPTAVFILFLALSMPPLILTLLKDIKSYGLNKEEEFPAGVGLE
ncbi:hypothetical protein EZ449_19465 [Pedobacter frigidisoli]|uniref:Membrane protein involved in the export of O-antigen and teichoic acid n=1 Tax=Pedobacter frigidisoli TaxID=2530455 RepID=A0A4V6N622_9SPHI|nr:oligosaccharide flippase family protein [Pedobacter frigidisoli]TCD01977.1 hypothetical protein EZ449_19465 [Pedobacter frigidisoli]